MITQTRRLTVVAVHGETDRVSAQRALDDQMARARDASGQLLPRDQWPEARCEVEVVLADEQGTRVEMTIRDWGVAPGAVVSRTVQMTIGAVPVAAGTAVVSG